MMISVVLCKNIEKNKLFVNFPRPRGPDLIAQLTGKTIVKS